MTGSSPLRASSAGDALRDTAWLARERVAVVVLTTLLLAALGLALDVGLGLAGQSARESDAERVRERVRRLAVRTEPDLYRRGRMLAFLTSVRRAPQQSVVRLQQVLAQRWGMTTYAYRFAGDGRLCESVPGSAPNRWLIERMFEGLITREGAGQVALQQRLEKKLTFAFGAGCNLTTLRDGRGLAVDIHPPGTDGMLAWDYGPGWGVVACCPELPDPVTIGQRVAQAGGVRGLDGAGFRAESAAPWVGLSGGEEMASAAAHAFAALPPGQLREGEHGGRHWVFVETVSGRVVYGCRVGETPRAESWRRTVRREGLLVVCVVLVLTWWRPPTAQVRLRVLAVGLFLVSAFIPVLGLGMGSLTMVEVYRQVLGVRAMTVEDEALKNLTAGFTSHLATAAERMARELETPEFHRPGPETASGLARLQRLGLAQRIEMREAGSRVLYSSDPGQTAQRDLIVRGFARAGLEIHRPQRCGEAPYRGEALIDNLMRADDMGFAALMRNADRYRFLQVGTARFLMYFTFPPAGRGPVTYIEAQMPLAQAVRRFLREQARRRWVHEGVALRLFAFDVTRCRWTLPPPPAWQRALLPMVLAAWTENQDRADRLHTRRLSGHVACLPQPALADHCLVAVLPDANVVERMALLLRKVIVGAGVFLVLILALAQLLSRHLLAPLADLEHGVAALGRRDFKHRLPELGADELGRLFGAFNEMMAEAADLALARSVQEGLIPRTFPQLPGYSCAGRLHTATDLGGDCLDSFLLPDGRLLFLVGDIAGHGIGSALLMAFARAVTFHWSEAGQARPEVLAADLDALLREGGNPKVFMSAVIGILDISLHRIDMIVCGHPYPLLVRADGTTAWLGRPGLPLGAGVRPVVPRVLTVELQPGDVLLTYTDGLIEGTTPQGEMVGYDRLVDWVVQVRMASGAPAVADDAALLLAALLARHAAWCVNAAGDDVTVCALARAREARP